MLTFNYALVFAVKSSPFTFECPETVQFNTKNIPEIIDVECMLSVHSNVSGTIDLSCSSSSLKGVNCTTPPTYDISPGDSTANVGVRLDADASLRVGESGEIFVSASYGAVSKAAVIKVLIVGPGGDQLAIYNSSYGAPFCDLSASSCSSGTLLVGRGSVGPEPNAPNSIDGCEDGNKGVHHKDESVDKIIVRSGRLEGPSVGTIREEEYVTIIATVWAYSANDTAEFWITSNPINPSWDYIGSLNVTVEDTTEEIKMEVRLSKGPTQAVRVVFHYLSNANLTACPGGSWDDVDDLGELFTIHFDEINGALLAHILLLDRSICCGSSRYHSFISNILADNFFHNESHVWKHKRSLRKPIYFSNSTPHREHYECPIN